MLYDEELIRKAFLLYQEVIKEGEIKKKSNPEIYGYYFEVEIRDILEKIFLSASKTKIFYIEDTLYFVPEIENEVFSYSNEELRKVMGLNNNKELYLAQFIWMNVLSEFYGEQFQQTNQTRSFVKVDEIINKVKDYMDKFEKIPKEDLLQLSNEYSLDLVGMLDVWNSLEEITDKTINIKRSRKKIYGFYLKVLRFWEIEKLVEVKEDQEISLTRKMKDIVGTYYHNEKRILDIKELLDIRLQKETFDYAKS